MEKNFEQNPINPPEKEPGTEKEEREEQKSIYQFDRDANKHFAHRALEDEVKRLGGEEIKKRGIETSFLSEEELRKEVNRLGTEAVIERNKEEIKREQENERARKQALRKIEKREQIKRAREEEENKLSSRMGRILRYDLWDLFRKNK